MKKLKLIFWIIGILLVICSGSYFFGFAGAAIYGKNLSYQEIKSVLFIPKAILLGVGIKMLYDAWKN